MIIIFFGVYEYLNSTDPNYTKYSKCPFCFSNASYVGADDTYFDYYCENCGNIFVVATATPHSIKFIEKDSKIYNTTLKLITAEKAFDEVSQKHHNTSKN